ncbi:MAG: ABC transporter substrate-binding protein, partial [Anaerolineales bacterium]
DQHLAQLQRLDLVREKSHIPELEYMFKHSLTQEAAYNSLLLERRREFHRRVGEALEQLFADRKENYLGLLAHHFEAAGEHARAVDYLIQAGDQARLTDEHSEAIGYYQRALELLEDLHDETRLSQVWLKLGLIYNANFQFETAHQANEKAFAIQQKMAPQKGPAQAAQARRLRLGFPGQYVTLDPGRAGWGPDIAMICHLFSGLAEINEELDVIPAVARSWQVLEEGRRYIFHLRDDVAWTDGKPVTAPDFEWAWKRNLEPALHSMTAPFLYDITGAQDYHQGKNPDPDCVGVRALDAHTLEVRLAEPVAYFPFIVTMPVTYPLPKTAIESFGEAWWRPGQIVSNGAYCLVEFNPQHGGRMVRNPVYYGAFPGNAEQVEWIVVIDLTELDNAYLENRLDLAFSGPRKAPDNIPREEFNENQELGIFFLVFPPTMPPFNDLRVRKAFACSVNRQKFFDLFGLPMVRGGLVPPGMPGYSPDIGLPYDVDLARSLMAEAGYPGGKGFPAVKGLAPRIVISRLAELKYQWGDALGVEISFEQVEPGELTDWKQEHSKNTLVLNGWQADYPDPDNFLRQSDALSQLHRLGWQDAAYDRLVEQAGRTPDRAKRMTMYRQADRLLVSEQVLVLPLFYNWESELVKPWVKKERLNLLGYVQFHKIIIDEH